MIWENELDTYIAVNIAPTYNAPMVGAILVARSTTRELSIAGMLSRKLEMTWVKSKGAVLDENRI